MKRLLPETRERINTMLEYAKNLDRLEQIDQVVRAAMLYLREVYGRYEDRTAVEIGLNHLLGQPISDTDGETYKTRYQSRPSGMGFAEGTTWDVPPRAYYDATPHFHENCKSTSFDAAFAESESCKDAMKDAKDIIMDQLKESLRYWNKENDDD